VSCAGRDGRLRHISSSKEETLAFSTVLFMKCFLSWYKVSVYQQAGGRS
jgi:hypothetical protein